MYEHRFYFTTKEYIAYYSNSAEKNWDQEDRFLLLEENDLNQSSYFVNMDNLLFYTAMMKKNDVVQPDSQTS